MGTHQADINLTDFADGGTNVPDGRIKSERYVACDCEADASRKLADLSQELVYWLVCDRTHTTEIAARSASFRAMLVGRWAVTHKRVRCTVGPR